LCAANVCGGFDRGGGCCGSTYSKLLIAFECKYKADNPIVIRHL
jgi:hypothetical protein